MSKPQFRTSSNPKEEIVEYLSDVLKRYIALNKKVLLLVPGGSAIVVLPRVAEKLKGVDCANLSVTLTDERYGEVGHKDSNWQQIMEEGFDLLNANLYHVLQGKDEATTALDFRKFIEDKIKTSDYIIGLFGIGRDGHTSGILPESRAIDSKELVCGYQSEEYYRITTTPLFLSKLDEVIVYATGASKKETLEKLRSEYSIGEQPAQALKQADKFIIFND